MKKRMLGFWSIWNMSFGFLGIQMGFALQNSNVSRIFQTLGANIDDIPILWVAAPLTGLIVQPIIGYFSDRTWTKLGRRKPYFLVGAILASAALFIMPNSPVLWFAAGMLWIMDASINISMEPFRAFVGDNLSDSQRTTGFAMQSFFIGIGAYFASKLPLIFTYFGVSNTAPLGIIPDSVKYSFYFGGIAFIVTVLWTVVFSKEYSPEELEAFEKNKKTTYKKETHSAEWFASNGSSHLKKGIIFLIVSGLFSFTIYNYELKNTAAHTTDRSILFDFIISDTFTRIDKNQYEQKLAEINEIEVDATELIFKEEKIGSRENSLEQSILTSIKEASLTEETSSDSSIEEKAKQYFFND